MCATCYAAAHDADMRTVRVLKFTRADHIIDNIYLGGEGSTIQMDYLEEIGVTRVLTVAAHSGHLEQFDGIQYKVLDIDDSPSTEEEENMLKAWPDVFEFIKSATSNVLVHCVSGISRSGATVIAYIMAMHHKTYDEALQFVRSKRPCVHPNSGFQRALKSFEETLAVQGAIASLPSANGTSMDGGDGHYEAAKHDSSAMNDAAATIGSSSASIT
jgi:predicted protein tyrosine phosphatase